jgi:hypothetical protein
MSFCVRGESRASALGVFVALLVVIGFGGDAAAQSPGGRVVRRRARPVATTQYRTTAMPSSGPAGSFYPTPTMFVRGNGVVGGGYSPFGMNGDYTLSLYGPLSPYRATAAPVLFRSTGYGGSTDSVGTGFSTPNLPGISNVIYPTRANVANGFGYQRTPPWWDSAFNFLDQN